MKFARVSALIAVLSLLSPAVQADCPGFIAELPRGPRLASQGLASKTWLRAVNAMEQAEGQVGITYLGHSSFLIQSPQGVGIITDYNDYVAPLVLPDIVTMNNQHDTHYTPRPDPRIRHILRGWALGDNPTLHDLRYKDVEVRNVPTHARNFRGAQAGTRAYGNSIFLFNTSGICIAHLGHLHHLLNDVLLSEIGKIDVLMIPIDGMYTMSQEDAIDAMEKLKAPLNMPMHYFGPHTLERFLTKARPRFPVRMSETATIAITRSDLPDQPEILVLPGR